MSLIIAFKMIRLAASSLPIEASLAVTVYSSYSYTSYEDNIGHWYDLRTSEACDPFDCGSDSAPPEPECLAALVPSD